MSPRRLIPLLLALSGLAALSDGAAADLRARCKQDKDPLACIKYKALNLIDEAVDRPALELTEGVRLVRRGGEGKPREREARGEEGEGDLVQSVEELVGSHDLEVDLGGTGLKLTASAVEGSVALKVDSGESAPVAAAASEGRSKKLRLRKMLVPVMVFLLLKAMTLIPLALGVLGLKAWNALQLSFFSFVTSLALAIFNLCKKVASDSTVPVAHTFAAEPYHYAARNLIVPGAAEGGDLPEDAHQLAYSSAFTQPARR